MLAQGTRTHHRQREWCDRAAGRSTVIGVTGEPAVPLPDSARSTAPRRRAGGTPGTTRPDVDWRRRPRCLETAGARLHGVGAVVGRAGPAARDLPRGIRTREPRVSCSKARSPAVAPDRIGSPRRDVVGAHLTDVRLESLALPTRPPTRGPSRLLATGLGVPARPAHCGLGFDCPRSTPRGGTETQVGT